MSAPLGFGRVINGSYVDLAGVEEKGHGVNKPVVATPARSRIKPFSLTTASGWKTLMSRRATTRIACWS